MLGLGSWLLKTKAKFSAFSRGSIGRVHSPVPGQSFLAGQFRPSCHPVSQTCRLAKMAWIAINVVSVQIVRQEIPLEVSVTMAEICFKLHLDVSSCEKPPEQGSSRSKPLTPAQDNSLLSLMSLYDS